MAPTRKSLMVYVIASVAESNLINVTRIDENCGHWAVTYSCFLFYAVLNKITKFCQVERDNNI